MFLLVQTKLKLTPHQITQPPGRTVTITPHTRQIINVGAGEISATSTDAINGSQLYMIADQVGKNKTRIDNIRARSTDVKVKRVTILMYKKLMMMLTK